MRYSEIVLFQLSVLRACVFLVIVMCVNAIKFMVMRVHICCSVTSVSSVTSGFGIQFPISVRGLFLDGCRPGRFGSKIGSGIRFGEKPPPAPPAPRGMEK
jgi:hypothetical protein